jgi:hypothetical protein
MFTEHQVERINYYLTRYNDNATLAIAAMRSEEKAALASQEFQTRIMQIGESSRLTYLAAMPAIYLATFILVILFG